MQSLPTDLEILNKIYEQYYVAFRDYETQEPPKRATKVYVPVDIAAIARDLNVDPDIVFGRLYYHLEPKYRYRQEDRAAVHFFELDLGGDTHVIHFPYMASILANLRAEQRRHDQTTFWTVIAIVVSAVAILISIFTD